MRIVESQSDGAIESADRRREQRFPLQLPVTVKAFEPNFKEESSFTTDVSARGAFFFLDSRLPEGTPVEMILTLPAEITLSDDIRVRCRGKIVRVLPPTTGGKTGIAALIEKYDFTR